MSEWIKHDGEMCPVENDVCVEVKFRNGKTHALPAGEWFWGHSPQKGPRDFDIIAYRIVKPEDAE